MVKKFIDSSGRTSKKTRENMQGGCICSALLSAIFLGAVGEGAVRHGSAQERRSVNECPAGSWLKYECTGWRILGGSSYPGDQEGTSSLFHSPSGVSVSPDGSTVFVADPGNQRVRRIQVATRAASTVSNVLQAPYAIDMFPDGERLAVSDLSTRLVHIINISTGFINSTCGRTGATALDGPCTSISFSSPLGISVYPDGTGLAVADGDIIRGVDVQSSSTTVLSGRAGFVFDIDNTYADGSTAESRFFDPHGLDVAADGKIFVADTGNGCMRKVQREEGDYMGASLLSGQTSCVTDGQCKGIKGPPSPWSAPVDVAATPDGRAVFVADAGTGSIRVVSMASGREYIIAGQGTCGMVLPQDPNAEGTGLTALAVSPAGDEIFFTYPHRVGVISLGQRGCVECTAGGCSSGEYRTGCGGASFRDSRCEKCNTSHCQSGYFRTTCDGMGSIDSQCMPCTPVSCGAGEYRAGCAASEDSTCRNCTTSNVACPSGHYRTVCDGTSAVDSVCVPCTLGGCAAGEWRDASTCTTHSDAICRPCSTIADCGPDEYVRQCSANADALCAKCTNDINCGEGMYWSKCSKTADGQCILCSKGECPANQYRTECGKSSDSICSACTKGGCQANFYRGGCETTMDARCIACTVDTLPCTPGLQYSKRCTADADKQCVNCTLGGCVPGFYRERCSEFADGKCLQCSTSACEAGLFRSTCRPNADSLCVDEIFALNFTVSLDIKLEDFNARRLQTRQGHRDQSIHALGNGNAQGHARRSKQQDFIDSISQAARVEAQHVSIIQVIEDGGQGQDAGILVRTQISNLASKLEVEQISLEIQSGTLSAALARKGMPGARVDLKAWETIETGTRAASEEGLPSWVIAVSAVLGSLICIFGCIAAMIYKAWKYLPQIFPPRVKQAWTDNDNKTQEKYKEGRNSRVASPTSRAITPAFLVAGCQPTSPDSTLVLDSLNASNLGWGESAAGTGLPGQRSGDIIIPSESPARQHDSHEIGPGRVGRAISVGSSTKANPETGPRPDMYDDNAPEFRSPARLQKPGLSKSGGMGDDALMDVNERGGSLFAKGGRLGDDHIMTEQLIGESRPAYPSLDVRSDTDFSEIRAYPEPVTTSRRARTIKLKPLKGPRDAASAEMIWPVDAEAFAEASEPESEGVNNYDPVNDRISSVSPPQQSRVSRRGGGKMAWSVDSAKS